MDDLHTNPLPMMLEQETNFHIGTGKLPKNTILFVKKMIHFPTLPIFYPSSILPPPPLPFCVLPSHCRVLNGVSSLPLLFRPVFNEQIVCLGKCFAHHPLWMKDQRADKWVAFPMFLPLVFFSQVQQEQDTTILQLCILSYDVVWFR